MNKLRVPATSPSMMDWGLDPGSIESVGNIAKAGAVVLDALTKALEALKRRRNAKRPADRRELEKEVDELRAELDRLVDLFGAAAEDALKAVKALDNILRPPGVPDDQKIIRRVGALLAELRRASCR
jgi:hypothetical protein